MVRVLPDTITSTSFGSMAGRSTRTTSLPSATKDLRAGLSTPLPVPLPIRPPNHRSNSSSTSQRKRFSSESIGDHTCSALFIIRCHLLSVRLFRLPTKLIIIVFDRASPAGGGRRARHLREPPRESARRVDQRQHARLASAGAIRENRGSRARP